MFIQRTLSALVLIAAAAVGALLLRPDLFPEVALPAFLAESPQNRVMLGLVVSFATGAIVLGLVAQALRFRYADDDY